MNNILCLKYISTENKIDNTNTYFKKQTSYQQNLSKLSQAKTFQKPTHQTHRIQTITPNQI